MAQRKRNAVFPGDVWMDLKDGMTYSVTTTRKDPSHGGVLIEATDAYHSFHELGELEILNHFYYVCDQHGDNEIDFFG